MKAAITGAYGYSGRQIALELLRRGVEAITLTNSPPGSPAEDPFEGRISAFPLDFSRPEGLERALAGCDVLINTYWVRFNHKSMNFVQKTAVENTTRLFRAARQAGVRKIIHVSIANPELNSPFEYYHSKAVLEQRLQELGVSYTILRPTVLFGQGTGTAAQRGPSDILMNNIAWTLRRFPIVGVFFTGSPVNFRFRETGNYHIRPIHVLDFARLAADAVAEEENRIIDAVGPEDYSYRELLTLVGEAIGCRRILIPVPLFVGCAVARLVGLFHRDVFLTRQEIGALTSNLLTTSAPAAGGIRLGDWLREHADTLGRHYASELARRRNAVQVGK